MEKGKMNVRTSSKTHAEFISTKDRIFNGAAKDFELFTDKDVLNLPSPVRKYFSSCGYIGTPKTNMMKAIYHDVNFLFGNGKRITIDYVQYNVVNKPARIAYIGSSMYGIPFEGLDSYVDGKGSMKGVLAGRFTMFNQCGEAMNKAGLTTFLSECLIIPNAAIQEYITWVDIDALHAKATISCYGDSASGIFSFHENGEMLSFETNDRKAIATNGTNQKVKWSAVFSEYRVTESIRKPTKLQAIWHYDDGDLLYFDSKDVLIK
jgi:hypothetical protein